MPLAVSFTAACARGLGLGNGEAPRVPTSVSVTAGVVSITSSYTITISTFPLARVEYRISSGADAGQYTGSLPGASGSNDSGTISTRVTTAGATENLLHATTYTLYLRAVDASGQIGPETAGDSFTTGAEVAPIAATPSIDSPDVSYPTAPFLQFTWGTGTAGTYSIGTRQYSVVAGSNPGAPDAGGFTTLSGTSGTTSVTTTYLGAAITPGTEYTVYLKYTASSPGTGTNTAHATYTTAAEILPGAPTAQVSSWNGTNNDTTVGRVGGRTSIVILRGNVPTPPTPTYLYKYQYAYGTSINPDNWADFPSSGQASSVTVSSLSNDTIYYVRTQAVSLGTDTPGAASDNATGRTNPAIPPTPTLDWNGMSGSSYETATFTVGNNGDSTTSVNIFERPTSGSDSGADTYLRGTGTQTISGYVSDGGTLYYVAYNFNRLGEASSPSGQLYWTRPAKNQPWNSGYIQTSPIFFSTTVSCASEFSYTFGAIPDNDNQPGYVAVSGAQIDGIQATGGTQNGCAGTTQTVANTSHLYWRTTSGHPGFGFGLNNSGLGTFWGIGTFSTRYGSFSSYGGSALSSTTWSMHATVGSRTGGCAVGCSTTTVGGVTTLNAYRLKNFILTGVYTTNGSGTGF